MTDRLAARLTLAGALSAEDARALAPLLREWHERAERLAAHARDRIDADVVPITAFVASDAPAD